MDAKKWHPAEAAPWRFSRGASSASGANASQSMYVYIESMRAVSLGIGDSAIDTLQKATDAIIEIDNALTRASEQRSEFGAYQNRLEHTLKSLEISYENISNAESRIGDADMAKEMMELVRNNILNQASISILTRTNQAPEMLLQLLR